MLRVVSQKFGSALLLLAACGGQQPPVADEAALPSALLDLALIERVSGDDARTLIAHLHPGPLAPAESDVGFYASDAYRAVLYVSRFGSADTAYAQLAMMARLIARGRGGFGHHVESEVGGVMVHATLGQGRVHYFYSREAELVWLAADPPVARNLLAELLQVPVDSLPAVPDPGG